MQAGSVAGLRRRLRELPVLVCRNHQKGCGAITLTKIYIQMTS
jgi:hypothetical protein